MSSYWLTITLETSSESFKRTTGGKRSGAWDSGCGCGQLAPSPPSPQLQRLQHPSLWQHPEPRACCDHDKQIRKPSVSSRRRLGQQSQNERSAHPPRGPRGHPDSFPSDCCFLGCDYLLGISDMVEDNFNLSGTSAYPGDGRLG